MGDISVNVRVQGAEEAAKALRRSAQDATHAVAGALYLIACDIMRGALKLVPVDTGALRRSHFVERPSGPVYAPTLTMGFVAPYAIEVHEDLGAEHINGSAKFLEGPYLQALGSLDVKLQATVKRLMADKQGADTIPVIMPIRGEFKETGAKSRHSGKGAAARDRKARSKAQDRMAQRAAREASRKKP